MSETNKSIEQTTTDIAVIKISPARDDAIIGLLEEGRKLKEFAVARTIARDEDLKPATDDLSLIAKLKKALNEKKAEYVKPIKAHLDAVNAVFTGIMAPFEEADIITRQKITAYRASIEKARQEAEAINQAKIDLAKREEALTGEHTVDLTPVEAPIQVTKVSTDMGTVGMMKIYKFEVIDKALVPEEYKLVDTAKVGAVVRASKGTIIIPGIKIIAEETLRVSTR